MTDREVLLTVRLTATDAGPDVAMQQLDEVIEAINAIGYVSNVEVKAYSANTWTFVGHWNDASEIVVEYVLPGEQQDDREDTGHHEGGLWAASASGRTQAIAMVRAIAEYEDPPDHDHEPADDQQADVLTHVRFTHQYAGWVDIAPDEATEIHNALHGKD